MRVIPAVIESRKTYWVRGWYWWAVQDLNLRPHACEACALTTELTARLPELYYGIRDPGLGIRNDIASLMVPLVP